MAHKLKNPKDTESRFEGNGVEFRGKVIGSVDIEDSRGDKRCQEAILRLKNAVKTVGAHKPKILINVTKDGLKITDVISKEVLHNHAVHRISFISRDASDNRAFGYIYGEQGGQHKFYAIKTAMSAEYLVLTLRDLFTYIYEGKKQDSTTDTNEETETNTEDVPDNPAEPSTLITDSLIPLSDMNDEESVYEVPPSNAPVSTPSVDVEVEVPKLSAPAKKERRSNLLNLQDDTSDMTPLSISAFDDIESLFDNLHNKTPSASLPSDSTKSPSADLFDNIASPTGQSAGFAELANLSPPPQNPFTSERTSPFSVKYQAGSSVTNAFGAGTSSAGTPQTTGQFSTNTADMFSSAFTSPTTASKPPAFSGQSTLGNPFPISAKSPFDDPFFSVGGGFQTATPVAVNPATRPATAKTQLSVNPFMTSRMPATTNIGGFTDPPTAGSLQPLIPLVPPSAKDTKKPQDAGFKPPVRMNKDNMFNDLVAINTNNNVTSFRKTPREMFSDRNTPPRKTLIELQLDVMPVNFDSNSSQQPQQDLFGFSMFDPPSSNRQTEEPVYSTVKKPTQPVDSLL